MMKNRLVIKLLSVAILVVMCLSFVACKKDNKINEQITPTETATADTATKDSVEKTEALEDETATRTPREIAESVINVMWVEFDAKKAYEMTHPLTVKKACEVMEITEEEYIATLQEALDDAKKEMEESDGSMQCTILKENPLDQERLTELKTFYAEINLVIEKASVVLVENKAYEGEKELGYYIQEITCAKIDGEWYLVDFGAM